jgi:hypothetical protein
MNRGHPGQDCSPSPCLGAVHQPELFKANTVYHYFQPYYGNKISNKGKFSSYKAIGTISDLYSGRETDSNLNEL